MHDLITHVFINERMNDFEEMLLHHMAAISLYFCYIFGNVLSIGSVIAYLHDLADILGKLSKCLNTTVYQKSSVVAFLLCVILWGYTRIYWLPQMIYYIFTEARYSDDLQQFMPFITLNGVFLSIMFCLHVFWFLMFFKILARYVKTGEAEDTQNKV